MHTLALKLRRTVTIRTHQSSSSVRCTFLSVRQTIDLPTDVRTHMNRSPTRECLGLLWTLMLAHLQGVGDHGLPSVFEPPLSPANLPYFLRLCYGL